jgi:hypothetical protein
MADFVEVYVEATGRTETVPSHWLDDEVLGKGIRAIRTGPAPDPVPPTAPESSDVQTTGPVDDLPIIPAVRDAVVATREAAQADELPTETDTHAVIDAFAEKAGITFTDDVKTRADKIAVITTHLNPTEEN